MKFLKLMELQEGILILSLSKDLQDFSFDRLGRCWFCSCEINTGEVLALVTKPSFGQMILLEICMKISGKK